VRGTIFTLSSRKTLVVCFYQYKNVVDGGLLFEWQQAHNTPFMYKNIPYLIKPFRIIIQPEKIWLTIFIQFID
jgi:hypothetical protein